MNWRLLFWSAVAVFVTALAIMAIVVLSGNKFSLSLRSATVSGDVASYTVEIEADAEWVVLTEPDDWCYVTPYTGSKGRTEVTFAVDGNPNPETRELKIVFYSGNDTEVFVLKQHAGVARPDQPLSPSLRESAVAPAKQPEVTPPAKPQPAPVVQPAPATKPKRAEATASKPAPSKVVKPKPSTVAKAKQEPVKQETAGKVLIQENVLKRKAKKQPEPVKEEQHPVKYVAAGPCDPVEVFQLKASTNNVICEGESVELLLSNSQSAVSYQLFKDGRPVTGFVPGKGGELVFPGGYVEAGVYTAKSMGTTRYCATDMAGSVKLTVAEKFDPGRIAPYTMTLAKGETPPLIESLAPARGGDGRIGYRWTINGRFIEGATGETYQPAALSYNCTYTRLSHDETCSTGWTRSPGEVTVNVKR